MDVTEPGEPSPDDQPDDQFVKLTTREEAFAELADLNDEPYETPAEIPDEAPRDADEPVDADLTAPSAVIVVVTHNPGDWLEESLESLAAQTYDNLSILIIDAASDIDPTPRIAKVLPGAFVRRLEHNFGFGPTLNEVLNLVSGASFFCFCHDDVALAPDTIHKLIEEAFRSNAGVIGPKLVAWDNPEVLLQVGVTVDKTGSRAPYAERGELDQEQHDAVRDVFTVPGGCTLVRADLFTHLGGFDPDIDLFGEDLDFCWRAHLVGARVIVAPAARVRHREAMPERRPDINIDRISSAHRVRTILSCYRFLSLVVILPQAVVIALIEATLDLMGGRRREARAQISAWTANLRRIRGVRAARKRVKAIRETGDRDIRRLQAHSLQRLTSLLQSNRKTDGSEQSAPIDSSAASLEPHRSRSLVPYGVALIVLVLFIGTRDLFFGSLPAIGEFAQAPSSSGSLWSRWVGALNPMGLGTLSPVPTISGLLGAVGSVAFGSVGLLRRVGIIALLPIGAWGGWRLARPLGSRRAQLASLAVYATIPVPYNALSQGRWGALAMYAAAPWMLAALARSLTIEPFTLLDQAAPSPEEAAGRGTGSRAAKHRAARVARGRSIIGLSVTDRGRVGDSTGIAHSAGTTDEEDSTGWLPGHGGLADLDADNPDADLPPRERPRSLISRVLGLGLLLALVGMAIPFVWVVVLVMALGIVLGSLLAGRVQGLWRLMTVTVGGIAVAAVLQIPWTFGFIESGAQWQSFAGMRSSVQGWLSFGHIVRFESGTFGAAPLGYAFLLAGILPLVIGRGWRFAWASRAWGCVAACWALLWAGQQAWFPLALPPTEVLLAPAAAGLALAVACGMAAFDIDLPGYRFGWRQGVSIVAAVAVLVGSVPVIVGAVGGRWSLPTADLSQTLGFVKTQRETTPFRVLWLGDPDAVPVAGWRFNDELDYATSNEGAPTMAELWAPGDPSGSGALAEAVRLATTGQTTRLGQLLAGMNVRYVIIPRQIVPAPYDGVVHPIPEALTSGLANQLDLNELSVNSALVVYENVAWRPGMTLYPVGTTKAAKVIDGLSRRNGVPVMRGVDATKGGTGRIPTPGVLATGNAAGSGWELTVDGRRAKPVTIDGWEQGFVIDRAGTAHMSNPTPPLRWVLLLIQVVLWALVLTGWRRSVRRRAIDVETDLVVDEPFLVDIEPSPFLGGQVMTHGEVIVGGVVSRASTEALESAAPEAGVLEAEGDAAEVPDAEVPDVAVPEAELPKTEAPLGEVPDTAGESHSNRGAHDNVASDDASTMDAPPPFEDPDPTPVAGVSMPDLTRPDSGHSDVDTPDSGVSDVNTPDSDMTDMDTPDSGLSNPGLSDLDSPDPGLSNPGLSDLDSPESSSPEHPTDPEEPKQ